MARIRFSCKPVTDKERTNVRLLNVANKISKGLRLYHWINQSCLATLIEKSC